MGEQSLNGVAVDEDIFGVHLVVLHLFALDGLEGAGADVERDLITLDALGIEGAEDGVGEMKTGCGGGNGTVNLGIDGLIGALVALLGCAVEIGWYGQFAGKLEDFGEGESAPRVLL